MILTEKCQIKSKSKDYILTYVKTITSANQPVYVFKDKDNKEVILNRFDLKNYETYN
jgi:hypothetical protein